MACCLYEHLQYSERYPLIFLVGKNPTDEYLEQMMNEAPGPINFTMFLTLFGERLQGTDPEEVIKNAFACFDEDNTGLVHEDRLRELLTSMGDRFSDDDVSQPLKCSAFWKNCGCVLKFHCLCVGRWDVPWSSDQERNVRLRRIHAHPQARCQGQGRAVTRASHVCDDSRNWARLVSECHSLRSILHHHASYRYQLSIDIPVELSPDPRRYEFRENSHNFTVPSTRFSSLCLLRTGWPDAEHSSPALNFFYFANVERLSITRSLLSIWKKLSVSW